MRVLRAPAGLVLAASILAPIACTRHDHDTHAAAPKATAGAPDGPALVYERVVDGNQDVYMIPAGGGVERRLTDDPALDGLPRYGADGTRVFFTSERTGRPQIYALTLDGGVVRRVR